MVKRVKKVSAHKRAMRKSNERKIRHLRKQILKLKRSRNRKRRHTAKSLR